MYPVKGYPISTKYGALGPLWKSGWHDGVDFACPLGTPVYAARKGVITNKQWGKSYGVHIVQRRTFPVGTRNHLIYAHLSSKVVRPGDKVKKGQVIGYTGNTGNSTGLHLHFGERNGSTWLGSNPVNPQKTLEA